MFFRKDFSHMNIENQGKGELFHCQQLTEAVAHKTVHMDDKVSKYGRTEVTSRGADVFVFKRKLAKQSEFIVEDGYVAFIIRDGTRQETLKPGRYKIFGKKSGLAGFFDKKRLGSLRIAFISDNSAKKTVKWGIPAREMEMRDPATDVDFTMGAFGEMTVQVTHAEQFYQEWMAGQKLDGFNMEEFQDLVLSKVKQKVKSAILKTIKQQEIPYHMIDERTEDIAEGVLPILSEVFSDNYGIRLTDIIITKISISDEKKREIRAIFEEEKADAKAKRKKVEAKEEERELKADAKEDLKEIQAEMERLADKQWEKEKYMLELKTRDYTLYLEACATIGWPVKEKDIDSVGMPIGGICPKCGCSYGTGAEFCTKCGNRFVAKKCLKCGTELGLGAEFCSKCGTPVSTPIQPLKKGG